MSDLAKIEAELEKYSCNPKIDNPVGVFVGATSGIGLNTALQFAKATTKCSSSTIYIVGRNQARGEEAGAAIKKINPKAEYHFLKNNLVYLSEAKKATDTIKAKESKINILTLSQGVFPTPGKKMTEEGLDSRLVLMYYSKWAIINNLAPLLSNAATKNEPARVVTVLAAGTETKPKAIDTNDLGLTKTDKWRSLMSTGPTYVTMSFLYLAQKYPGVSFVHTFPGIVSTNLVAGTPWYMRYPLSTGMYLGSWLNQTLTPEQSGEDHLYAGLVGQEFSSGGAYLVSFAGKKTQVIDRHAKGLDYSPELLEKVWKHSDNVYKTALSKHKSEEMFQSAIRPQEFSDESSGNVPSKQ